MYIGAEVDDDEVFGDMLEYVFKKIPSKSKVIIAKELLENLTWNILRDRVLLAILENEDKEFIPLLEEFIDKEKNSFLKEQIKHTINVLRDIQ